MRYLPILSLMLALVLAAGEAPAQTRQTIVIQNGKVVNGASGNRKQLVIDGEQRLMLQASGKFIQGDLQGAELLYSQVITQNSGNAQAWLQRGLIRRELGDVQGMRADAERCILLVDSELARVPDDPDLFYRRSVANRLVRRFDAAERDLYTAAKLDRRSIENDMKAIALERKMAQ